MKKALIVIWLVAIVSMIVGGVMVLKAVVAEYNDIKRRMEHPNPHLLDEVAAPVKTLLKGVAAGTKEMGKQIADPNKDKASDDKNK